jgi:FdhD protein
MRFTLFSTPRHTPSPTPIRQSELMLGGRAQGKRFVALSGERRIVFDRSAWSAENAPSRPTRKDAEHDH